ncbi:hypothetical protein VFPFJ_02519 [Purpureocillium lilacinum]|uniref:Uncharacterized protein n=1 Tax=Purpureocillium lilacinum TaxID=33203 RepID=A0A179HSL3_PURLI|nr:hypothetical protein VFPFJ_02519 [Purpureocillium lilacinum]OAQ93357.1 hypothetical protein VFPFJ_02519 [Purpureocillium lilacinum]
MRAHPRAGHHMMMDEWTEGLEREHPTRALSHSRAPSLHCINQVIPLCDRRPVLSLGHHHQHHLFLCSLVRGYRCMYVRP